MDSNKNYNLTVLFKLSDKIGIRITSLDLEYENHLEDYVSSDRDFGGYLIHTKGEVVDHFTAIVKQPISNSR